MANPFAYPSSNLTSVEQLLPYVNSITGGYFGVIILMSIFIITFIAGKSFSTEKALSFSGFLTLIVGIMFRMLGLINDGVLGFIVIMFVGIVIYLWFSRQQESM